VREDGRIDGDYTRGPLNPNVKEYGTVARNSQAEVCSWRGGRKKVRGRIEDEDGGG